MLFSVGDTQFSKTPINTVGTVGSYTHFRCGGERLGWDMYFPGEENPMSISVYQNVTNTNKYTLFSSGSASHTLLIEPITLLDAGRYRCKYVPLPTLYREAELVVLGERKNIIYYKKKFGQNTVKLL